MAAQEASQPLRWGYGDVDDGNFAVRGRCVPLLVALLVLLICFLAVCLYLRCRWACHRHNTDATLPSSSSSSSSAAPASSSAAGLDAATILGLPLTLYRLPVASPGEDDAAAQCSICLGEFAEGEKVKALPRCGHCFHPECVDAWLRSRPSCPLCRGLLLAATTRPDVGREAV